MLHTTFALAYKADACSESYEKMAKALGGVEKYGKDTPIPLDKVLEVLGLNDALWSLKCTIEPCDREARLLACTYAEHVLPLYESRYPNKNCPRQCIKIARRYANRQTTKQELATAWDAAWATAWDAAGDIAGNAAWAAAGDAETAWQTQEFLKMLEEAK